MIDRGHTYPLRVSTRRRRPSTNIVSRLGGIQQRPFHLFGTPASRRRGRLRLANPGDIWCHGGRKWVRKWALGALGWRSGALDEGSAGSGEEVGALAKRSSCVWADSTATSFTLKLAELQVALSRSLMADIQDKERPAPAIYVAWILLERLQGLRQVVSGGAGLMRGSAKWGLIPPEKTLLSQQA